VGYGVVIEHMADEQETKVPDTVEVVKKEDEEVVSVVTEAVTAVPPPKEEEDGEEEPKTKDDEAVEAAESTATFEPVVSCVEIIIMTCNIYILHRWC
jgi:hypothetical protein